MAAREPSPPALRLSDLSKTFGGQKALDGASLEVAPGEVHGLLGQNGSGKSTLIKVLAGFHAPDAGSRLQIHGHEIALPLPPGAFRQHGMSFVHQNLGLIPGVTVLENVLRGGLGEGHAWAIDWRRRRRQAARLFESYGVAFDPQARVADLAPVRRALLAILRAVSERGEGGLLVLDEPTPFLPKRDVEQLFQLVRMVVARGASVIFVSHDVDEVMQITDRATVLRDGRVAALLSSRTASKQDFVTAIVGRSMIATQAPAVANGARPSHVAVRDLGGGAVAGLSLTAARGEVIGLTGLLGSGYDELPYLLYGARRASGGTLDIGGRRMAVTEMSPKRAIAAGIVLIPADRANAGAIGALPVGDNLTMPLLGGRRAWMLDRRGMVRAARAAAVTFEVRPADPALPLSALSGGNQQKVVLAKWLQREPALVLLDEPTQGVDIGARRAVFEQIARAAARGAAVLCASSDYEQLAAICTRVLIFSAGRVVASLTGSGITKDAIARRCLDAGPE